MGIDITADVCVVVKRRSFILRANAAIGTNDGLIGDQAVSRPQHIKRNQDRDEGTSTSRYKVLKAR